MEILETAAFFIILLLIAVAMLYGMGKVISTFVVETERKKHKYQFELKLIIQDADPISILLYSDQKYKTVSDILQNCECIKKDKVGLYVYDHDNNILRYFPKERIIELRVTISECSNKK